MDIDINLNCPWCGKFLPCRVLDVPKRPQVDVQAWGEIDCPHCGKRIDLYWIFEPEVQKVEKSK